MSLADIADIEGIDVPFPTSSYASFGGYLGILVAIGAVVAALRLPALQSFPQASMIAAVAAGVFLLWSALAMFMAPEGFEFSPAIGGIAGILGYIGLGAGQFLQQPIGGSR